MRGRGHLARAAVAAVGMALVACTPIGQERGAGPRADRVNPVEAQLVLASALQPFDACDELLGYVQEHALETVGPYGLGGGGQVFLDAGLESTAEGAADDGLARSGGPVPAQADAAGGEQGVDFSGTNVQEAGIDEPDIVKTDGQTVYAVAQGELQIIDVSGDTPRLVATHELPEGWDHRLLLDGDRLLILTNTDQGVTPLEVGRSMIHPGGGQFTTLTLVDVDDPADPTVTETVTLDGRNLSARMSGRTVRVVVRSDPNGLAFTAPEGSGLRAEREATEANREVIRDSTADNWIPYYLHETEGGVVTEGSLVDCERVSHPDEFSGLGTITILSLDLAAGLEPGGSTAVLAGGETVYASADRLYVATNRWSQPFFGGDIIDIPAETFTTELHAFDTTAPGTAPYVASGEVPGFLLSQWSLSEHDGFLRVATTEDPPWGSTGTSESLVTVLAEREGELEQVGQVGGLGEGEQIYAVRFIGDVGYVVTFRQTDPLYTIDLADPTAPTVLGELKILGYSAYLHPVGDDLLLGVGQDATEEGMTKGTQLSLFDVRDLANPQRIAQATFADGTSEVEYDHHAFLYWAPTGLAVVPVQSWSHNPETGVERFETGAVAFSAARDAGISERARLTHAPAETTDPTDPRHHDLIWQSQIRRSLVVGDTLYTVSELGLGANDLTSMADRGFLDFAQDARR